MGLVVCDIYYGHSFYALLEQTLHLDTLIKSYSVKVTFLSLQPVFGAVRLISNHCRLCSPNCLILTVLFVFVRHLEEN